MTDSGDMQSFLWIRQNITWSRLLIMALASWVSGMWILYFDGWSVDWASVMTVAIGAFTVSLGLAVKLGRIQQLQEDQGMAIIRLEGWMQQLLKK